jgi:hypothetical protein
VEGPTDRKSAKSAARQSEKASVSPFDPKSVIIITAMSSELEMGVVKLCRAKGTGVGVVRMECRPQAKVRSSSHIFLCRGKVSRCEDNIKMGIREIGCQKCEFY